MRTITRLIPLLALAAVAIAGCGGSSKAAGIQLAPQGGATQAAITAATTTATTPTSTVTTPKPPSPLSKKPTVTVPTGAGPHQARHQGSDHRDRHDRQGGHTVTVNYVGVLYKGGKEFDSSWSRNQTFTTPLSTGSVIPGWVQGIPA